MRKSKSVNRIGVAKDKGKAEEISQAKSVLNVVSTTTMQISTNRPSATIVVSRSHSEILSGSDVMVPIVIFVTMMVGYFSYKNTNVNKRYTPKKR